MLHLTYRQQLGCRYCEQARPVPHWVWRLRPSRLRFWWSSICTNEIPLRGYDSRLCMFSFYQIHPSSINKTDGNSSSEDGVTADTKSHSVNWNLRLTSKLFSGIKIFWKAPPNAPLTMIGIFGILVGIKCSHILDLKLTFAFEEETTSILSILPSKGVTDCISLSSEGDDTESYTTKDFEWDIQHPLSSLHGFTSSFVDSEYSDSLWHGFGLLCLQQHSKIYSWNSSSNQQKSHYCKWNWSMSARGNWLHLNDDNGMRHVFILDNCLYYPNLLVNLLSTHWKIYQ